MVRPFPSEKLAGEFLKTEPLPLPSIEEIGFHRTEYVFTAPEVNKDINKELSQDPRYTLT